MKRLAFSLGRPGWGWWPVWLRNFLVWRKLLAASVLGNLADPLIMMLGLGWGLGSLMPGVQGMSYMAFFAAGSLCSATMMTASFEAMFSAYSRMQGQRTWEGILHSPLTVDDVVMGELVWAASKAWLTGSTILAVLLVLGLSSSWMALLALPVAFLVGLCFAAIGLVMTVLARNWDFFSFYLTLVLTPMVMSLAASRILPSSRSMSRSPDSDAPMSSSCSRRLTRLSTLSICGGAYARTRPRTRVCSMRATDRGSPPSFGGDSVPLHGDDS